MFKGSRVEYTGNKKFEDNNTRAMEITIKAETEEEAYFLFNNLVSYMEQETGMKLDVAGCPAVEVYDNYVEYFDIIGVEDKAEFEELKAAYKEWKKSAKNIVMPVIEETIEVETTETVEPTVDHNSEATIVPAYGTVETTNITDTTNSKATITEPTQSTQPNYRIHTEPVENPYEVGRVIRVDLYNNLAITAITELQNYVLEQYTEGHTESNLHVTYWEIVDIKNDNVTITEDVISTSEVIVDISTTLLDKFVHNSNEYKLALTEDIKSRNIVTTKSVIQYLLNKGYNKLVDILNQIYNVKTSNVTITDQY